MTTDVQLPAEDDAPERDSEVAYPEYPDNPHNHTFTISMDGRGPMIVVRGNTPQEVNERFQALQDAGTTTIAAAVYSHMKAEMQVAQGLGPVTAVPSAQVAPAPPQGAPQAPAPGGQFAAQAAQQFNQQPAQQFPQAGGQAPAAWQNVGAPAGQDNLPEYRQAGWVALNVPFKSKPAMDALVTQYSVRKGRPSEGGQLSFNKANKTWYLAPEAAAAFAQFNPVPA